MKNLNYLNLNQLPSKNDGGQSCDGKRQSRLMSQSGCSAVDVPMTSYGASDEHPMSIRSASDERRWKNRGWKYVACMLMVLFMSIGQMWGETTIFKWQYDGSSVYGDGSNNGVFDISNTSGIGTIKFVTYEKKKTSADGTSAYASSVTDNDLKPSITKVCKLGNNGAHLRITPSSGDFKAGDVILICGYSPMLVTTSTDPTSTTKITTDTGSGGKTTVIGSSVATGSGKSACAVGKDTIPAGFVETDEIYISRVPSTSVGIAAIKVVRQAAPTSLTNGETTTDSQVLSWTAPASAPENGYLVAYSSATSTAPGANVVSTTGNYTVVTVSAGNVTETLSDLSGNTTYNWWVRAKGTYALSAWTAGSSFTTEAAAAGSGWGIAGDMNSWTAATNEMTGSGTVSTTISLSANTQYEFKVVDISSSTWYGNGGTIKGGITDWLFETSKGNTYLRTSCAGDYTFTFNTSTKRLSITYPNSHKVYFDKDGASWSNIYAYGYNDGTWNIGWPGIEITSNTEDNCGTEYYAYTNGYTYIIFNNGSGGDGNQTGNITVSGYEGKHAVGAAATGWEAYPTYTVTYNANGDGAGNATGTTGSVPTDSNSPYACSSTVTVLGNTGSLVKTGYNFTGWNTAPNGSGAGYTAGNTFTVSANTTLYAQWEAVKYTVTYNVNGGGSVTPTSATQASSGASVTLPTPTWSGYTFEGWYNAGTKIGVGGASYTPTADITLYAHWTDNISGKVFSFIDNNYGDKFKSFTGYGWVAKDSTGRSKTFTNASTGVEYRVSAAGWDKKDNAISALAKFLGGTSSMSIVIPTGKIATVKISYNAYGTGDDYRLTVNSTAQANPSTKLADGNTNAQVISNMKEITLSSQTGTLTLGISNTGKNNYIGRVSAVITGYTVSYAAGTYGSGSLASGTKTHGSNFTLSSSDDSFTRDGYVYDGWSTNADGSTKDYNLGGTYSTDAAITLYPHWVEACSTPAAPTGFSAGSISATGATFTITDAADAASYDIYYSTSSTAPTSGTDATTTSTSKTKAVTGLTAATTYYAWVRSVCDASHKSAWVALNPDDDTHTFATSCVAPTTVTISATVNEDDGYWFYPGDAIELTATPTGSPAGSPVTYQWANGGVDILGATSSTYSVASATTADAGKYTCTISYGACSTTSAEFELKCMQFYLKNSGGSDISNHALTKVDATHATLALSLTGGTTYQFRVTDGCNNWYGNSDATGITSSNCSNWTMPHDADCKVTTSSKSATYTFNFDFSAGLLGSEMKVSVVYPAGDQAEGKVIYWDNNVLNWASAPWYRIGKGTHNNKTQMTLVPGTANLYAVTTTEYNGFEYWHIANNEGEGTGNIFWTKDSDPATNEAITAAMGFEGSPVTADAVTFTPTSSHATGTSSNNDNCEFYEYGQQNGMKTDRVTISDYSNGTITVNYVDTDEEAASFTSGYADLAHTVILTSITAVANTGYDAGAITINGGAYSANYVVTGVTTIAASFTPHVYTITYKDQGNVAFSGTHTDTPSAHPTSHTYNTATNLNGATKAGYTFDGWYTTSACTGDPVTSLGATAYTADITLYAKWTANSYSVAVTLTDSKATQESGDTGDNAATHGSNYVATFEAVSGYELPSDVIVYIGESQATKDDEYTWSISDGTGTLTINGDEILDDITITVTATSTCSTPADPDGLAAGSISSSGVTFTITDDESPASYEIYYSTDDDAPEASTPATTTTTSKSKAVTGLTVGTTYYAWVRSVCDEDNKSDWVALTGSTFTTSAAPAPYYLFTPTNASVSMAHTGTLSGVFYTGQSVSNQSGTISTIEYSKGIKFGGQLSSLGYANTYFLKYDVRSTKSVFTVAATGGSFIVYQVSDGGTSTYTTYDVTSATTNTTFTITSSAIKTIYIGATGGNTNVKILQIKVEESGTIYKRAGEIGYSVSFVDGRLGGANGNDVPLDGMTIHQAQNYTPASSDNIKLSTNNTDYISFTTTAACQLSVTTNASSKAYYVASAKNGTTNETSATGTSTFNLAAGTWYINPKANSVYVTALSFSAAASGYTVSIAANPAGYGTVSSSSVTSVASGTTLSTSTNTLSVGATNVTATATSATAEYTYAFDEWTLSDGTALPSTVTADLSVYANFTRTPKNYDLTWNLGGGTTTSAGTGISSGVSSNTTTSQAFGTALTAPTVTKTGYTFAGWSSDVASTMPAANTTYTATWTAKQTTITIDANTSHHGSTTPGTVTATFGSALPSFTAAAGESGWNLTGYFTEATSGTKVINANGTLVASTDYADVSGNWKYETASLTLYAQYEEEGCTPQSISKVVVTGSSAGTTSGYNEKEYVGTPVISVNGKAADSTNIDDVSGKETGYKMSSDGNSIVFATLAKGTFQEGDVVKIGITRRNDTRVISSNKNVLTIYYGTKKDDADSLTTISTGSTTTSGALEHEGAGFYTYTLTAADVTKIGSKKGIGLFRASSNGENPYVYSVEIIGCRDWTTCTAPTAVAAGSVTGTSATFTITDAENTLDYELYVSTSSTSPTAESEATATSSSKTKVITGLTASTEYYYWVRSNCGGYKSEWVAGTPATFTTEDAATTYSVTYNENGSTDGTVPTDATAYEEGDVVTVKANTGSLVKTGYTFVGWSTNSTASSGTFYPVGYKFAMPSSNQTLYAVWGSTGATCVTLTDFETSSHDKSSGKPDSEGKYFYGYKGTKDAAHAVTITAVNGDCIGANSGANLKVYSGKYVNIYADNTTTGGTPSTFTNVTSVSIKAKVTNVSYIATFDIMVGSTTIADNVSLSGATTSFQTFTYSGLDNLSGKIKIINNTGGSSSYNFLVDDIQICSGSGAASGFDVTFDMNGHGSAISTIENVPSGAKIGEPLPQPTATDYAFGGWYKEDGCTNVWNFASETVSEATTLYAKWTTCAPTISAHPSGTSYTKDAAATALSVTAATNDGGTLEYQWYSNEVNSTEDGAEITGATSASYTPNTSLIGTTYYYCIVSNDCGMATSNTAAITVNDAKSDPTATWTIAEPTHGGKGFSFSVAAKQSGGSAWDGTLTAAMLSASADVVLSDVTVSDNTISGTYGVKVSATSPVSFFLELPSTTACAAATLEEDVEFTACSGTGGDGETYKVPMKSSYESKATGKPDYRCENEYGYISPELGTSSVSLASEGYDDFDYYINSGRSSVLVATKVDAVKKIQIYLNANSGAAQVTGVYAAGSYSTALKDYTSMTEKTDYTVSYTDEEGNTSIAKGKNGYIELAFTANLDEGTLIYVVLKKAAKYYGAKLTVGSGSGATVTTTLAWSNTQASGATVEKGEDDADFTITATRSDAAAQASMGEIRYLSSDTKVATVNAVTGQVTIADGIDFGGESSKTTTITAMLLNSGCYKGAKITYTLQVNKSECTDAAGTIEITEDNGCEGVVMIVSGYEEGASIVWYKDGSAIPAATGTTYTATTSGSYTVVTTKTCARTSNSIVVTMSATATASKIVDSWYVKNGRRTPDIALVQTTGATSFTVKSGETTIWDEANSNTTGFGGCDFELKEDGIIYLHGTKKNGDAPSDLVAGNETITVTVSGCGGALDGLDIIIKKQAETLKPSVAFVVDGTTRAKGGTATSVSAAKTSERPLWTYLSSSFSLTGCNIYWSVDSKELREYYSQYDAIVVTDDPNTQTTGAGGVEYVKAFGTLVDVRPILTMEAYVGRYTDGGWHVYNATPTSPNPRQVEMKLECKNHEIFAGVSEASDNVRSVTINGDDYWYITIVDTTQSPYKGTTKDYKDLPALQGFDPSSFSDMLGIGTIKEDELQAGVERQQEPAARMMILGIQNNAMGALTNEGKLIIKNAISYLLKTNMEEVDDCSNYFTGATSTDWTVATNWSKNSVPDFATKVRILAPVVIENGQKVRASQVDIVVDGTSSKKDGELNGHVTINPGGALVVGGTVNRAIAPHYGIDDLEPTTDEDLFIQADASNNAALILDNSSGLTGATVQMYSRSHWAWNPAGTKIVKYWSYVAVPIQEALIPDYFYGAFTYYYVEKDGWDKKWDGDYLYPFQAIGLSRDAPGIENFWGPLVSTENRDIKLTKTYMGGGENMIANSWTAPIQIANFDIDDFGDAKATIYMYDTGIEGDPDEVIVEEATGSYTGTGTAGQWLGIPVGVAKLPEYNGLNVIPAMQTFEVDFPSDPSEAEYGSESTLHLDYNRLVRGVDITEDNLTERLHAPKRSMSKNDGDVEAVMKVRVAGVHTLADVWLIQDGAFSDGYDNGWEANYAACDDRSPQLYAHSEMGNMGVIAKPELEGTILGFAPSRDGADYTFSFYYRGDEELYLNDLLMETSTPITNEDTYAFTASENGDGSRFIISSNPYETPQIITGTEVVKEAQNEKVKKFIYNDKLYIFYRGMIFDANGKLINRK